MLRFSCRERETDQWGVRRWEPRELAGAQHGVRLQKRRGPHLQKGQNPGKVDFISFKNQMKGFLSSGAVGPDPTGAQLCEENRVQAFFIIMSHLPPSNLHHWSKCSAAVSSSRLFPLSLFFIFLSFVKMI